MGSEMCIRDRAVSAVVFASREPQRLAEFYRRHLGIPFEQHEHGPMRNHMEAQLGDIHLAVLPGVPADPTATGVSATFRVRGLDRFVEDLAGAGVRQLHEIVGLGEGRRLVSFRDADENRFSLIDLGF